jgi:phage shock protein A
MMDSQENALNQGLEEAKQPEMTVEQTANDAETTTDDAKKTAATVIDNQQLRAENTLTKKIYNSKKEIVERRKGRNRLSEDIFLSYSYSRTRCPAKSLYRSWWRS